MNSTLHSMTSAPALGSDAPAARVAGHLAYLDEEIAKISTREGLEGEMEKPFALLPIGRKQTV